MIQLAQKYELTLEDLTNKLGMKEMEIGHKERVFAAEAAMEERRAADARAKGEEPRGSGGFISA
jgi:hypothetical protein